MSFIGEKEIVKLTENYVQFKRNFLKKTFINLHAVAQCSNVIYWPLYAFRAPPASLHTVSSCRCFALLLLFLFFIALLDNRFAV